MTSWQWKLVKGIFWFRRVLKPPRKTLDVAASRRENEALAAQFKTKLDLDCTPVDAGGVPAEWVVPPAAGAQRVILYLHGGAYNSGSIDSHRSLAVNIAQAAKARALLLDYRLAPEFRFPAPVEDAVQAYGWLLSGGVAPDQVIVAGDSAGGGLVVALLLHLREIGQPLPQAGVCLSPWTDLVCQGDSWTTNLRKDLMLSPGPLRESAQLYLAGADPHNPLASPLYADLTGLPPLLIQVGSDELILSDSTGLAERASAAGVAVTLQVWNGMQHEWHFTAGLIPEGQQAIEAIGTFIDTVLV
jgi:epsilon-lactone hydrolase